jgi:hypothetical protein
MIKPVATPEKHESDQNDKISSVRIGHKIGLKMTARHEPKLIRDDNHPDMWRVRWPDGHSSDMTNLSRANDALACFVATLDRQKRGRQTPLEGRTRVRVRFESAA